MDRTRTGARQARYDVLVGDDVLVVDDEAGSPPVNRIAVVIVTGEPDRHGIVARDDQFSTEHP
jgi:hypothetical protein